VRGNNEQVRSQLRAELINRLQVAGITVDESNFTHLAYASEIAGAMLRRQQAQAVVAARRALVEGAVGMVEMALEMLSSKRLVESAVERPAALLSHPMVGLCLVRETQPIVTAASHHQSCVHDARDRSHYKLLLLPTIATFPCTTLFRSCLCVRDRGRDAAAPAGASRCGGAQSPGRRGGRDARVGTRNALVEEARRERCRAPRGAPLPPHGRFVPRTRNTTHRHSRVAPSIMRARRS